MRSQPWVTEDGPYELGAILKLLNMVVDGQTHLGLKREADILDLTAAAHAEGLELPLTMEELITSWSDARSIVEKLAIQTGPIVDELGLKFAPVVSRPEKVICVGLNYKRHAQEANLPLPLEPLLFGKYANSMAAHRDSVDVSRMVQIDYEAELVVVIGRSGKNVSTDDALDYVFGYANANDLSERERQFRSGQWLLGKAFDRALPVGPYLVTKDEIPDPNNLYIKGWLNNELRQDSHTSDMVFGIAEIVSFVSQYMGLAPGDVISTGTPEGVIMGRKDKKWMQPGDTYSVEIEGLGRLSNTLSTSL